MAEKSAQSPECMIFLLAKAYQRGHALVKRRLSPFGLTNLQYVILEVLWREDGLAAVDIGTILSIDKATMSGVLDRMAESGWIEKRVDDNDRRVTRVFLTEKAKGMKEALQNERQAANEELLSALTTEETILLRRLLKDLA